MSCCTTTTQANWSFSVSVGKPIVIAVTVTLVVLGIIAAIAGIIWKKRQSPILPTWVIMTLLEAIVRLCFCKLASMRVVTCWFNLSLQCNNSEEADSRAEPGLPRQTASTQLPCIRPTGDVLSGAGIWSKNCSNTFLMTPDICRLTDQSLKDLHLHHLQRGPNPNQSFRSTELHQLHQGTNPHHPFQTTQLHGRYQSSPAFNQFSLLFQLEKKLPHRLTSNSLIWLDNKKAHIIGCLSPLLASFPKIISELKDAKPFHKVNGHFTNSVLSAVSDSFYITHSHLKIKINIKISTMSL